MAAVMMIDPLYLMGFLLVATATLPLLALAASAPAVGSMAPAFTLTSQEGTRVSLSDYRGQWVVLYFYPRDFTSGCTLEAHNFQRDQALYQEWNAVILGVSLDSTASHKEFCTKEGLSFKLLADTEQKVSKAYGSLTNLLLVRFTARHTFIIDPEGRVARVFTRVSPRKHSEEVLAALAELREQDNPSSRKDYGEVGMS